MGVRNAAPRCPPMPNPRDIFYRTIATSEWGGFVPAPEAGRNFYRCSGFWPALASRPRGPPLSPAPLRIQRAGQVGPRRRVGFHQKKCHGLLELFPRIGLGEKLAGLDEHGLHPVVDGQTRGVKDGQQGTPFPGVLGRAQPGLQIVPQVDIHEQDIDELFRVVQQRLATVDSGGRDDRMTRVAEDRFRQDANLLIILNDKNRCHDRPPRLRQHPLYAYRRTLDHTSCDAAPCKTSLRRSSLRRLHGGSPSAAVTILRPLPAQSRLMPMSLTMRPYFSSSRRIRLEKPAGARMSGPGRPDTLSFSAKSACARILWSSARSRATTGAGVPAGANRPDPKTNPNPGKEPPQ